MGSCIRRIKHPLLNSCFALWNNYACHDRGKCQNREHNLIRKKQNKKRWWFGLWWSKYKLWANTDLHYSGGRIRFLGGVSIPSDRLHLPCAHFHNLKKPEKTGFNLLYKQWSSEHEKRRPACVLMKHCNWWQGHCIDHRSCVKIMLSRFLIILFPQLVC